jgi:hypothetical protein
MFGDGRLLFFSFFFFLSCLLISKTLTRELLLQSSISPHSQLQEGFVL